MTALKFIKGLTPGAALVLIIAPCGERYGAEGTLARGRREREKYTEKMKGVVGAALAATRDLVFRLNFFATSRC